MEKEQILNIVDYFIDSNMNFTDALQKLAKVTDLLKLELGKDSPPNEDLKSITDSINSKYIDAVAVVADLDELLAKLDDFGKSS